MAQIADVAMPVLLMSAFRGLVDAVHARLDEAGFAGVRPTHGFAMQAIGEGCTSVELGARLGVSKQAAAKTAAALAAMGLITREPGVIDRRERILRPTPHGAEMLAVSAAAFAREVGQWRARVGDRRVDATLATLAAAPRGQRSPTDLSDWG